MRDLFRCAAPLHAESDGSKFVRSLLGQRASNTYRLKLLGIVENISKYLKTIRLDEVIKQDFVRLRDSIRPSRIDSIAVEIAHNLERWIAKRGCIGH